MADADKKELTAEEVYDRWLRAEAEIQNMQKRHGQAIALAREAGTVAALQELLPVYDDLGRQLEAIDVAKRVTRKMMREGVTVTLEGLKARLRTIDVEGFDVEGKPFTPACMDAIAETPTTEQPPGTVVKQLSGGFTRRGRLLRAAQVAVAVEPKDED